MVKTRHLKKSMRNITASKKGKGTTRKYKHRGGGDIKDAFLEAIKNPLNTKTKSYTSIEDFFEDNGKREKKTLTSKDGVIFTYWVSGVRPVNYVVEKDGKKEIVGFVAD